MGADYAPVLQRLGSERIVTKFALRFLEDKTFSGLCDALDAHDAEEAFRMAHTLKGICLNLGFEPLRQASSELTEELQKTANDSNILARKIAMVPPPTIIQFLT